MAAAEGRSSADRERSALLSLPCEPRSIRAAREFVRDHCRRWGAEPVLDTAVLVVSELVTNALRHAPNGLLIGVRLAAGRLRVEVHDSDTRLPRLEEPPADALTGRGIVLVARLADAWGTEPSADGKAVWAEFRVGT